MRLTRLFAANCRLILAGALILLFFSTTAYASQLQQQTVKEWSEYIRATQAQMQQRVEGKMSFLWLDSVPDGARRARSGEILVAPFDERTPTHVTGGLIHHWIGTSFIPGARIKDLLDVVRDYPRYKDFYRPIVIASAADGQPTASPNQDDSFFLRLRNESVLSKTALDVNYSASYVQLDPQRCYAVAQTTRVQEVDHYGEPTQRTLQPDKGNGYIWRLYTTTRLVERDGGVYIEVDAIALSRDVPVAMRWFVDPIVRRVSRDALSTSLSQTAQAVHTVIAEERKANERNSPVARLTGASFVPAQ